MWSLEFTRVTTATRERIWAWYEDTDRAPSWDPLVGRIMPDGPLAEGVTGRNRANGLTFPFTYTSVDPLVSYTEVTSVPGARMAFTHVLAAARPGDPPDTLVVTHGLECRGRLAGLYKLVLSRTYRKGMAEALANLIRLAEDGDPPGRAAT